MLKMFRNIKATILQKIMVTTLTTSLVKQIVKENGFMTVAQKRCMFIMKGLLLSQQQLVCQTMVFLFTMASEMCFFT